MGASNLQDKQLTYNRAYSKFFITTINQRGEKMSNCKNMLPKLACFALSFSIASTGLVATEAKSNDLEVPSSSISQQIKEESANQELNGVKGKLAKFALNSLADMIRDSVDNFIYLAKKHGGLDDQAADSVKKNSSQIADALDDVAEIPDLVTHQVRSEVYKRLEGPLGSGNANVVANAVEGVMWFIL